MTRQVYEGKSFQTSHLNHAEQKPAVQTQTLESEPQAIELDQEETIVQKPQKKERQKGDSVIPPWLQNRFK
mgnify:FL=1